MWNTTPNRDTATFRLSLSSEFGAYRYSFSKGGAFQLSGLLTSDLPLHDRGSRTIQDMGQDLSRWIGPEIGRVLVEALANGFVRLEIESSNPVLDSLPWEAFWLGPPASGPACLCPRLTISRWIASKKVAGQDRPFKRLLVVRANPSSLDYPDLPSAEPELLSIVNAIGSAECRNLSVEILRFPTVEGLRRELLERPPDLFHFIGHADILPSGTAFVLEADKLGTHTFLYADELSSWLQRAGVRYGVLSCCDSATNHGLATSLIGGGVEAVVGMQGKLSDTGAHLFSRAFYASLAEGSSLESSVHSGRQAIAGLHEAWATPVLFCSNQEQARRTRDSAVFSGNFKAEDQKFFGRKEEISELTHLLTQKKIRHVTVTGLGGMGKTRLSRELATRLKPTYGEYIWLIECDGLASGREVLVAICSAMGISGPPSVETMGDFLSESPALVILDCFEGLVHQSHILDEILRSNPSLQLLVTSRILLGGRFESEYVLEPLGSRASAGGLKDGMKLFLEAAGRASPTFKVNRANRLTIQAIVKELDAVPLALILAAGRLKHITLEELQGQIRVRRLEVLKRRQKQGDKHADMLRVVDDSFRLLDLPLRDLLVELSVFRGGFYLDDVFSVFNGRKGLLDGIAELRENSLLIAHSIGSRTRYRILDTIREFLTGQHPPAGISQLRDRHLSLYSNRANEMERLQSAGRWSEANALLWSDAGNFHSAIGHGLSKRSEAAILTFGRAISRAYFEAGMREEFAELCQGVLDCDHSEAKQQATLVVLGLKGQQSRREGDLLTAEAHWRMRAELAAALGNDEVVADSWLDLVEMGLLSGNASLVHDAFMQLDAMQEVALPPALKASCILVRARRYVSEGSFETALEASKEAEKIIESEDVTPACLYIWMRLSETYRAAGDLRRSELAAIRMILDALAIGAQQSVGKGLMELHQTFLEMDRLLDAANCLATCALIPRAVSTSLRDEAVKAIRRFHAEMSSEVMTEAEQWSRGKDPLVLAGVITRSQTG